MTYIIADTQKDGKKWAKRFLSDEEKYKVLSTPNQVRGLAIIRRECVYVTTSNEEMARVLVPSLCGCRVTSCNLWIVNKQTTQPVLTKKATKRLGGAKA